MRENYYYVRLDPYMVEYINSRKEVKGITAQRIINWLVEKGLDSQGLHRPVVKKPVRGYKIPSRLLEEFFKQEGYVYGED